MPTDDSVRSEWLPQAPVEIAGSHGFLKASDNGHLEFTDGTPVRFTGTGMLFKSCFPDSLTAIATAKRLRKLGINMVRFDYMDYNYYEPYSTIATGTRSDTLSPSQMRRLDFFIYQLKQQGIYTHFVLKSLNTPRAGDGVAGWDSVYFYGQPLAPFSRSIQEMQRRYMTAFFNHVNPFTKLKYVDDAAVALVTVADRNSTWYNWLVNYLSAKPAVLSYQHSRMIDTLFTDYLRRKYTSTAALKTAWWEGTKTPGPNIISNPGFESFTSNWNLIGGEGTTVNNAIIQGTDVPPGEGNNSLHVVIDRTTGTEGSIYLYQTGMPIRQNHIYRFVFKAKTDTAAGRPLRIIIAQGAGGYGFGLDTTVMLTTAWQTYSTIFRAIAADSINTALYLFAGAGTGDLFLDGFMLQETGREGLKPEESLENYNVARAPFTAVAKYPRQRIIDQGQFYDSIARNYYRTMRAHLQSLGVRVPIAGTNFTYSAADSWVQSENDFTSNGAYWDSYAARAGTPYSDSIWVMSGVSVLNYRNQKIPELNRGAIAGKPFIADAYAHVYPNPHRSEMMLFYPAYAMLQDWDGAYFYTYNDGVNDTLSRRSITKGDYWSIESDPSLCALLPQVSAMIRNHWVAPAQRLLKIQHDEAEMRALPFTYYSTNYNTYNIDFSDGSTLDDAVSMVSRIRLDSFNATRHYTGNDYYSSVPENDNIASDTREIVRDAIKGVMTLNTPMVQGGSGAISTVSSLRTDELRVGWIDGGKHITWLWSTLDTTSLKKAERSLLTVTTRALNSNTIWHFGDSSIGKTWGGAPVEMEGVKLGVNFYTDADSLFIYPLDTTGLPTGKQITAAKMVDSWRVTLDLAAERTPWFGVRQLFLPTGLGVDETKSMAAGVGQFYPNPARDEAVIEVATPDGGAHISAKVIDVMGRVVASLEAEAQPGRALLPLDTRGLANGSYTCTITMAGKSFARRFIVSR
jgi:hypothetical protein